LQHDNDPKHTVKAALEWLRNKTMNEEFFPEHLFMVIFSMFMVKLDEEF